MDAVAEAVDSFWVMRTARCKWCHQVVCGLMAGERHGARWLIVGRDGRVHNLRRLARRELASIPRFREAEPGNIPVDSEVETELEEIVVA